MNKSHNADFREKKLDLKDGFEISTSVYPTKFNNFDNVY